MSRARQYAVLGPLTSGVENRAFLGCEVVEGEPRPDQPVVVVWLPSEVTEDKRQVARLQRETAFVTQLEHPHVIGVHGLECFDEGWARVVDFADGEPLQRITQQASEKFRPIDPRMAARIILDVASGVRYAHEEGQSRYAGRPIVHGGVRPDTIIMTFDGRAVLTGYGAAVLNPNQAKIPTERLVYLAPEQIIGGKATASPATDIYGIGCVLYELLTGHAPYADEEDIERAILTGEPPLIDEGGLAGRLGNIAATALAKRGADRFESVEVIEEAIQKALGDDDVELPSQEDMATFVNSVIPPDAPERTSRIKMLESAGEEDAVSVLSRPESAPAGYDADLFEAARPSNKGSTTPRTPKPREEATVVEPPRTPAPREPDTMVGAQRTASADLPEFPTGDVATTKAAAQPPASTQQVAAADIASTEPSPSVVAGANPLPDTEQVQPQAPAPVHIPPAATTARVRHPLPASTPPGGMPAVAAPASSPPAGFAAPGQTGQWAPPPGQPQPGAPFTGQPTGVHPQPIPGQPQPGMQPQQQFVGQPQPGMQPPPQQAVPGQPQPGMQPPFQGQPNQSGMYPPAGPTHPPGAHPQQQFAGQPQPGMQPQYGGQPNQSGMYPPQQQPQAFAGQPPPSGMYPAQGQQAFAGQPPPSGMYPQQQQQQAFAGQPPPSGMYPQQPQQAFAGQPPPSGMYPQQQPQAFAGQPPPSGMYPAQPGYAPPPPGTVPGQGQGTTNPQNASAVGYSASGGPPPGNQPQGSLPPRPKIPAATTAPLGVPQPPKQNYLAAAKEATATSADLLQPAGMPQRGGIDRSNSVVTQFNRRAGDSSRAILFLAIAATVGLIAFVILAPADTPEGLDAPTERHRLPPELLREALNKPKTAEPTPGAPVGTAAETPVPPTPTEPTAAENFEPPPPAGPGKLSLRSEPRVTVYAGKKILGRTPFTVKLPPGVHRLRLTDKKTGLNKYRSYRVHSEGHTKDKLTFGKGKVVILAPDGAQVTLNSRNLGKAPLEPVSVYEGSYLLRVSLDGMSWHERFKVEPGQRVEYKVRLK